jgi:hypothetical protein
MRFNMVGISLRNRRSAASHNILNDSQPWNIKGEVLYESRTSIYQPSINTPEEKSKLHLLHPAEKELKYVSFPFVGRLGYQESLLTSLF